MGFDVDVDACLLHVYLGRHGMVFRRCRSAIAQSHDTTTRHDTDDTPILSTTNLHPITRPLPTLAQQPAAPQHRADRVRSLPAVSRSHALFPCAETLCCDPDPIASGFVDVIVAPAFPLPPPPPQSTSPSTGPVRAVALPRSYSAASATVLAAVLAVRQAQQGAREDLRPPVPC